MAQVFEHLTGDSQCGISGNHQRSCRVKRILTDDAASLLLAFSALIIRVAVKPFRRCNSMYRCKTGVWSFDTIYGVSIHQP